MSIDFIVPGFPKSGTSSLHDYLNLHPDISMSLIKEPHIYSKNDCYEKRFDISFHHSIPRIFEKYQNLQKLGESSTSYMISPLAPGRIFNDNPSTKFIVIARDPIDRLVSHYNWLLSNGENLKPFSQEIKDDLKVKFDIDKPAKHGYKSFIEHSLYGQQLEQYLSFFPRCNFLFLSLESLKSDPQNQLDKCFEFLGLKSWNIEVEISSNSTSFVRSEISRYALLNRLKKFFPNNIKHNIKNRYFSHLTEANSYRPTSKEIEWLQDYLHSDIEKFKVLTSESFKEWRNFD